MKLLCVVGNSGTGKSTFLKVASELGIASYDMSSVVYEKIKEEGKSMNVVEVVKFASSLREKFGQDIVARLLFDKIIKSNPASKELVVVSGLRQIEEYLFFKNNVERIILVGLRAEPRLRYERILKRKKESNPQSYEEFLKKDELEGKWGFSRLFNYCDIYIDNNSTLEKFENSIRNFLNFVL